MGACVGGQKDGCFTSEVQDFIERQERPACLPIADVVALAGARMGIGSAGERTALVFPPVGCADGLVAEGLAQVFGSLVIVGVAEPLVRTVADDVGMGIPVNVLELR